MQKCNINKKRRSFLVSVFCFIFLFFVILAHGESKKINDDNKLKTNNYQGAILADFEKGIPCSHEGDSIGFRKQDKLKARIVDKGSEGSVSSAIFTVGPDKKSIFFQGDVRRKYLATKSSKYIENGLNALSFWLYLSPESSLINKSGEVKEVKVGNKLIARKKKKFKTTLGVWTYHWRYGDIGVGGESNNGLTTDSMMHGYSDIAFNEKATGKWINVVLSTSAFHNCRNYFHFYSARGTTDDLKFFPSLRQLQFRVLSKIKKNENFQIDQIKLIYKEPTAEFGEDFYESGISRHVGNFSIPVTIKNPTNKDRSYRVFISSFLGVERKVLNKVFALTNNMEPMRKIQHKVNADGGIGAVDLVSDKGKSAIKKGKEIFIPSGSVWRGKLIHYIKRWMLGKEMVVSAGGYEFIVRRNTLTTSVVIWDPNDPSTQEMDYVTFEGDNSDDGNHRAPGFPRQKPNLPPEGWRSKDIPRNQVGGYFVSVIHLKDE